MSITWILVADRSRARLLALDSDESLVQQLDCFSNAEGRMRPRELESDRPPTTHDRFGHGRHAVEPHTPSAEKVADRFAQQLRDALETGRSEHAFDELVLIAPPRFLGALHHAMGPRLRERVALQIDKELTGADERSILSHIERALQKKVEAPSSRRPAEQARG